ncbi:hypothetical protein [Kangiella aquimarina]|uniref:Uncharacterized protein n=1 Tax=Kangiella aquimarina TaxID=261965 RepID=A0ABZ0X748_9GAMM|nr:hypothetical protein [Kangiella aquimarina]WQG86067.1 hypothetical protein SR900_04050 [Kangiella aquimarina]
MKGKVLPLLVSILMCVGIIGGCQQNSQKPRLDTTDPQAFNKTLKEVRAQVDDTRLKQFDQAIKQALHTYQTQKEFSLLPTSNPLDGLSAEQVLELSHNQRRHDPRKLRAWGGI